MTYDYHKSTWLNPNIEYLFDNEIIEYDMSDAGFTLVKQFKLLPEDKIESLELMDKGMQRHIAIGKLQGEDKAFSEALLGAFAEMRKIFISFNNLDDNNIISVKKDAFFTVGHCKRVKFGNVIFSAKNQYTSYIRFSNIEIYYSIDKMDIKGISEIMLNRHRLYMYEFLQHVIAMIERKDPQLKRYMKKFIAQYKAHELEDAYYLEFNSQSANMNPMYNFQKIIIPILQIITKEMT